MKGFNPIIRQRVSPINLETVANTYRELEQGHQKSNATCFSTSNCNGSASS